MDENMQINESLSSAEEELNTTTDAELPKSLSEEQLTQEDTHDVPPVTAPQPVYTYRWDYTSQSSHDTAVGKDRQKKGLLTYATILSVAFLVSIVLLIGVMIFGNAERPFLPSTDTADTSIADLYEFCHPSYVAISTITQSGGDGAGSGIIMTANGYICTNQHVVENAKTIKVILSDERMYTAEYVDGDKLNDIAIIKINVHGLTPAKIGNSQESRVGDRVMAIGTPYGIDYRGTMTSGFISALDRQYVVPNDSGTVNKVQKLIQTDTSVNPGNSGGPLFNMKGEVIGVVAMKIAGSEYEGMGFAIPIETVIDMINDIIENGKITNSTGGAREGAALGISGYAVEEGTTYADSGAYHYTVVEDPETGKRSIKYPVSSYVELYDYISLDDTEKLTEYGIQDFTLYTAPKTGIRILMTQPGFHSNEVLKVDDVILTANGMICDQMSVIQGIIAGCSVGDVLNLQVYRNGQTLSITIELGRSANME